MSESIIDEKPFDSANNDDQELLALGYKPSFKREFTNLATVSLPKCKILSRYPLMTFSPRSALRLVSWYEIIDKGKWIYSIYNKQGMPSSIATTLNTPLLLGGPSSVSFTF